MKTTLSGMKDPFLIDYKKHLQELVSGMKTVRQSSQQLLIVEMIRSRWIRDRRASYPYEVAWVFDRSEESTEKVLKGLEASGDIEQVGLGRGKKDEGKPYKPRSLRKSSNVR